jgi:hypothetical protein
MYEKYVLVALIGCAAAVAIPAFVHGAHLRGALCLALATTPFIYIGWQNYKDWREERQAERPPDPPA